MNTETSPILKIESLQSGYRTPKGTIEVSGMIDMEIASGELVAVVGPNGVGKSTLLRTIAGVQPPLKGKILLKNKPLHTYRQKDLAENLSIVLTERIPSGNLTAAELIALGRQPYTNWIGSLSTEDIAIIDSILEKLDLTELRNRPCYEMSDGQLQRVMIGRALAQDTPLIVLDEPTSHLDIYHKAYIFKLLRTIAHDTSKTVFFSSHEIDLAIQLCDKVLVLQEDHSDFGTPCDLIEKGSFMSLFPSDLIRFDKDTGTYKIEK